MGDRTNDNLNADQTGRLLSNDGRESKMINMDIRRWIHLTAETPISISHTEEHSVKYLDPCKDFDTSEAGRREKKSCRAQDLSVRGRRQSCRVKDQSVRGSRRSPHGAASSSIPILATRSSLLIPCQRGGNPCRSVRGQEAITLDPVEAGESGGRKYTLLKTGLGRIWNETNGY